MDYNKAYDNLGAGSFKPEAGIHNIEILSEPEETEYVDDVKGTTTPQIKLMIKVLGQEMPWYMGIGTTLKSAYGQLMALGKHKGKLMGEKITLAVTSDAEKKNSYSIQEAVAILPELKAKKDAEEKNTELPPPSTP